MTDDTNQPGIDIGNERGIKKGKDAEGDLDGFINHDPAEDSNPDYSEANVCRCGHRNQQHTKISGGGYECRHSDCDCKNFKRV